MPIFIISKFDEDPIKNTVAIGGHLAYYIPMDHLVAMQANDLIRLAPNLIHKYPTPVTFLLFLFILFTFFLFIYLFFFLFGFYGLFKNMLLISSRSFIKGRKPENPGKNHPTIRKQDLAFPHVTRARLESQR